MHIGNILPEKSSTHSKNAPLKPKNSSGLQGRKVRFIDYLKSVKREFTIMGLYLQLAAAKAFDSKPGRCAELKHRISYIRSKDNHLAAREAFGVSYLMPSRNQVRKSYFHDPQNKMQNEINRLAPEFEHLNGLNTQDILKNVKNGICAGACMNFAQQILPFIEKENFSDRLRQVAKGFKSGVGAPGVVGQLAYQDPRKRKINFDDSARHILDNLVKIKQLQLMEKEVIFSIYQLIFSPQKNDYPQLMRSLLEGLENPSQASPEITAFLDKYKIEGVGELVTLLKEIAGEINSLVKSKKEGKIGNASDLIVKILENNAEKKPRLALISMCTANLCQTFAERLDNLYKNTSGVKKESLLSRIHNLLFTSPKNSPSPSKKTFQSVPQNIIDPLQDEKYLFKAAKANQLNLSPIAPPSKAAKANSDKWHLKQLKTVEFESGVYAMHIETRSSRHATLIIKNGDDLFLWDPNFGLIACDKNDPAETISQALGFYDEPEGASKGDHKIQIYKYSLIPSQT